MLRRNRSVFLAAGLLVTTAVCSSPVTAQLIGSYPAPDTSYLSFADSPLDGGIEIDHLQYGIGGVATVPEPDAMTLLGGVALLGMSFLLRRSRR